MLLAMASLRLAGVAADSAADRPHSHIHAPAEIDEEHGPLLLQITYTGEVMANVACGHRRCARYQNHLDLVFDADLYLLDRSTGPPRPATCLNTNTHPPK